MAQRAEVGRATIYRHWPRLVDLITEALMITERPLLRGAIDRDFADRIVDAALGPRPGARVRKRHLGDLGLARRRYCVAIL